MKIFILSMLVVACGTEPSKSDAPAPKPKDASAEVAPTSDLDPLPADWSPCHPQPKCPDAPLPEPTPEAPKVAPVDAKTAAAIVAAPATKWIDAVTGRTWFAPHESGKGWPAYSPYACYDKAQRGPQDVELEAAIKDGLLAALPPTGTAAWTTTANTDLPGGGAEVYVLDLTTGTKHFESFIGDEIHTVYCTTRADQ